MLPLCLLALAAPPLADVDARADAEAADLLALYQHLHRNPELSLAEEKSAARMAEELAKLGFAVTPKVGGHGVVGVLKNGPGPTVLVRADMDALPVTERTGLPYASTVRVRDRFNNDTGVMHACGHDMHMTCGVGTARVLVALKDRWSGTLVMLFQPAEEIGAGARAMLADGLFTRFPKPDYALALHVDPRTPVGRVAYTDGLTMANVDTVDIVVRGKGGHGAAPHTTIDPVVLAARIVVDLQTIVSREVNPTDPAVVTVGSIQGGTKHNIIPNEVKLQLTVRSTSDEVRDHVLRAIDRIARACAAGARAPDPVVTVNLDEFTPSTVNDGPLTQRVVKSLRRVLGDDKVTSRPPILGGEDFGRLGLAGVPICLFFLGTVDPDRFATSQKSGAAVLPSTHADSYAPVAAPSIRNGVRCMGAAVLDLMPKP